MLVFVGLLSFYFEGQIIQIFGKNCTYSEIIVLCECREDKNWAQILKIKYLKIGNY